MYVCMYVCIYIYIPQAAMHFRSLTVLVQLVIAVVVEMMLKGSPACRDDGDGCYESQGDSHGQYGGTAEGGDDDDDCS